MSVLLKLAKRGDAEMSTGDLGAMSVLKQLEDEGFLSHRAIRTRRGTFAFLWKLTDDGWHLTGGRP